MTDREPVPFTRRRILTTAVAAACGLGLLPLTRLLAAGPPATGRGPFELPLAAADLYAPHDLAG